MSLIGYISLTNKSCVFSWYDLLAQYLLLLIMTVQTDHWVCWILYLYKSQFYQTFITTWSRNIYFIVYSLNHNNHQFSICCSIMWLLILINLIFLKKSAPQTLCTKWTVQIVILTSGRILSNALQPTTLKKLQIPQCARIDRVFLNGKETLISIKITVKHLTPNQYIDKKWRVRPGSYIRFGGYI